MVQEEKGVSRESFQLEAFQKTRFSEGVSNYGISNCLHVASGNRLRIQTR
jgi:hypothetical protein